MSIVISSNLAKETTTWENGKGNWRCECGQITIPTTWQNPRVIVDIVFTCLSNNWTLPYWLITSTNKTTIHNTSGLVVSTHTGVCVLQKWMLQTVRIASFGRMYLKNIVTDKYSSRYMAQLCACCVVHVALCMLRCACCVVHVTSNACAN